LKFPLAPFTSADAELTPEDLAALREAFDKGGHAPDRGLSAMLRSLPTASHPAQFCTLSVLPGEPVTLGKDALAAAAPFVAIVAAGQDAKTPIPLSAQGGSAEVKLAKLRAPGAAFELRFYASEQGGTPAATLSVPSRWSGMYLVHRFRGQPVKADDRRTWDVELDVGTPGKGSAGGATKSIWVRLEFDTELPELPWYP
jgi:hypothetical protein